MSLKLRIARLGFLACLLSFLVPSFAQAASITTLFDRNNGGSFGGAVYFDLLVGGSDLSITGLDTNTIETGVFAGFEVYLKTGTAFGNETNAGLWSLQSTGTLNASGQNVPSNVALATSILLNANTLYGIALVMPVDAGHDYTNTGDNGSLASYSNADLTLNLGSASNTPFTAGIFSPRTWNGTLHYDLAGATVPEPGTLAILGIALAGLGVARRRRRA